MILSKFYRAKHYRCSVLFALSIFSGLLFLTSCQSDRADKNSQEEENYYVSPDAGGEEDDFTRTTELIVNAEEIVTLDSPLEPASTYPYFKDGLWGYASEDGDVILSPRYEAAGFFQDNVAAVKMKGKYGLINRKGELLVPFAHVDMMRPNNGLIPVRKEGFWGCIDSTGQVIIPFEYEEVRHGEGDRLHIRQNRQWGIISRNGEQIVAPLYDMDFTYDEAFALVRRNGKEGLIDKQGNVLIPCKYNEVIPLSARLYRGTIDISYKEKNHYLISLDSIHLPGGVFEKIEKASDSTFVLKQSGRAGVLSVKGDTIVPFQYEDLMPGNTNILAAKRGYHWGYINTRNETIIPFEHVKASACIGGLMVVGHSDYGQKLINYQNQELIPVGKFKISIVNANLVLVDKGYPAFCLYKVNGSNLSEECYDRAEYHAEVSYTGDVEDGMTFATFKNGYAIVGRKGHIGMIDRNGNLVIPMKYHHLEPMGPNGYTVGMRWDKYGLIDKQGNELTPFIYDRIRFDAKASRYMVDEVVKDGSKYSRSYRTIGYLGADGKLYSDRQADKAAAYNPDKYVQEIRAAYQRIQSANNGQSATERTFLGKSHKGTRTADKFVVKDLKGDITYEYYYDNSLNRYGPFFIFKVDGDKENRYYFRHGKIIRWVDDAGKQKLVPDGKYAPEHEAHVLARKHLAEFNNQTYYNDEKMSARLADIDQLCQKIRLDVREGAYKRGDHNSVSMGEYQVREETYVDQNGKLIYSSSSSQDEGGSSESEQFYQNGEPLRLYSNEHWTELSVDDKASGWASRQYGKTTYYDKDGNEIRVIITEEDIVKILK